jgi:hypothetical protein
MLMCASACRRRLRSSRSSCQRRCSKANQAAHFSQVLQFTWLNWYKSTNTDSCNSTNTDTPHFLKSTTPHTRRSRRRKSVCKRMSRSSRSSCQRLNRSGSFSRSKCGSIRIRETPRAQRLQHSFTCSTCNTAAAARERASATSSQTGTARSYSLRARRTQQRLTRSRRRQVPTLLASPVQNTSTTLQILTLKGAALTIQRPSR